MTVLDQGNGRDKILVYRAQGEDATPEEVVLSIQGLRSLRYEGIVLMRSQMKRQIEAPDLEVGSHMSCDIL